MTRNPRRTPGRRTVGLAALVATASLVLAACSGAANPSPTLPSIPPVTPTPVPSASAAPSGSVAPTPDLSGCPKGPQDLKPLAKGETRTVTIETAMGTIVTEVSGDLAPVAAANFVQLAECGYYDGVVIHRVVPDFVIQGGDGQFGRAPVENPDHMGYGGPGYEFEDEPVVGEYVRGTLAMANAGEDTNGSQFFIVLADWPQDPNMRLYTIFGKVTSGMDVVDEIAAAPQTPPDANGTTRPVDPVEMTKVTVSQ